MFDQWRKTLPADRGFNHPEGLNFVNRLTVALSSLPERTDWQPIESAPKDGRTLWLWWKGERRVARWLDTEGPYGRFANWVPTDRGPIPITVTPTHWMPLPDPPRPSGQKET